MTNQNTHRKNINVDIDIDINIPNVTNTPYSPNSNSNNDVNNNGNSLDVTTTDEGTFINGCKYDGNIPVDIRQEDGQTFVNGEPFNCNNKQSTIDGSNSSSNPALLASAIGGGAVIAALAVFGILYGIKKSKNNNTSNEQTREYDIENTGNWANRVSFEGEMATVHR